MQYFKPNVKISGNWITDIERLMYFPCEDYDLKNAITACAVKSASGKINDLYKSPLGDETKNYKYTRLADIPCIMSFIEIFKFDTTRIRIFKQDPGYSTPMHIDKDNENIIRMWMALNEDGGFKFFFGKEKEEVNLSTGEILFFNPNYLHGAANLGNKPRYTLNICGIPNKWIKDILEIKYKIIYV